MVSQATVWPGLGANLVNGEVRHWEIWLGMQCTSNPQFYMFQITAGAREKWVIGILPLFLEFIEEVSMATERRGDMGVHGPNLAAGDFTSCLHR